MNTLQGNNLHMTAWLYIEKNLQYFTFPTFQILAHFVVIKSCKLPVTQEQPYLQNFQLGQRHKAWDAKICYLHEAAYKGRSSDPPFVCQIWTFSCIWHQLPTAWGTKHIYEDTWDFQREKWKSCIFWMRMIYFMACPLFRYRCESQGLLFISLTSDKALNSCNQFQGFCELSSLTGLSEGMFQIWSDVTVCCSNFKTKQNSNKVKLISNSPFLNNFLKYCIRNKSCSLHFKKLLSCSAFAVLIFFSCGSSNLI